MTNQTQLSTEDKALVEKNANQTQLSTEDKALVDKMKQRARKKLIFPPLMVIS